MKLSTRLTMAMVALVLFAIAVTGILTYRNLLDVAVPRSLERLDGHVQLLAAELQAVVRAARADVLAFAVEQMASGGSGDIADASNVFAAAERRQLTSRFSAELTAKSWYDEWRIVGAADDGREIIRVDRSGAGGASRAAPTWSCSATVIRTTSKRRSRSRPAMFTSRRSSSSRRAGPLASAFRPCGSRRR